MPRLDLLTCAEVARLLQISRPSLSRLLTTRKLAHYRLPPDGSIRIARADLETYAKATVEDYGSHPRPLIPK